MLALCGSLAAESVNKRLLRWLAAEAAPHLDIRPFDGLEDLPLFNPDRLGTPPDAVGRFKDALAAAAGVLLCSPEYAMGPPGALKNALDWTVATADFSGKATMLVTAASLGEMSHASLLGTLRVIEAGIDEASQLLIPFAKAKLGPGGIPDAATADALRNVLRHFTARVREAAG